jgi:hypothetical protein
MVLTSWFFLKTERKKNCTNRLKDERRGENRRTLSYSVSLKDTLRMKKTSKKEKKNLGWPTATLTYVKHPRGSFPFFSFFLKKIETKPKNRRKSS